MWCMPYARRIPNPCSEYCHTPRLYHHRHLCHRLVIFHIPSTETWYHDCILEYTNTKIRIDTIILEIWICLFVQVAAVEAMYFLKNASLVKLSEQQLVDCSSGSYGNGGCDGGNEYYAFLYYRTNFPELTSKYPVQYQAAVSWNIPL